MAKRKSTFWEKIRFRYRVSILNENTLSESFHIRLSRLSVFILTCVFAFVSFALLSLLIFLTPIKHYLPGYTDATVRHDLVVEMLQVDSLTRQMELQQRQLLVMKEIIAGEISLDTLNSDSLTLSDWAALSLDKTAAEAAFCAEFEKNERYNLSSLPTQQENDLLVFVKPTDGIVFGAFDAETRHFGLDLTTATDAVVLATLGGTISLIEYSLENGYVIAIQHEQEFISIYKNCGRVLKNVGDKVRAGEAIGFVGGNSQTPCLTFELWQKGNPVNPANHIIF